MRTTIIYEKKDKPTEDQLREVIEASKRPLVYDEDCPELSEAMQKSLMCAVRNRDRIIKKKPS